jgi:hypothetical protein
MSSPRTKPLNRILELDTYTETRKVLFKSAPIREIDNDEGIEIPVAIVYRMYYLGRAYDFQSIKLIEPKGKVFIPYVDSQLLIAELEKLSGIVKDPVVEHYLCVATISP